MKKITAIILFVFTLTACEGGPKEGFGTLLGAVGGAVVGSAVSDGSGNGAVIGALIGGAVGNGIGRSLDEEDRRAMLSAQQVALETYPSGQASTWYNPDTGNSGSYVPQPAVQRNSGQYCREYQQTVTIGGQTEEAYGTACRQPDGTWKISNNAV